MRCLAPFSRVPGGWQGKTRVTASGSRVHSVGTPLQLVLAAMPQSTAQTGSAKLMERWDAHVHLWAPMEQRDQFPYAVSLESHLLYRVWWAGVVYVVATGSH
jgi:hypothetical protein